LKDDMSSAVSKLSEISTIEVRNETLSADVNDVPASNANLHLVNAVVAGVPVEDDGTNALCDTDDSSMKVDSLLFNQGNDQTSQDSPTGQEDRVDVNPQDHVVSSDNADGAASHEDILTSQHVMDASNSQGVEASNSEGDDVSSSEDAGASSQSDGPVSADVDLSEADREEIKHTLVGTDDQSLTSHMSSRQVDSSSSTVAIPPPVDQSYAELDDSSDNPVENREPRINVPNEEVEAKIPPEGPISLSVEDQNSIARDMDVITTTDTEKKEKDLNIPDENPVTLGNSSDGSQQPPSVVKSPALGDALFDSSDKDGPAIVVPPLTQSAKANQRSVFEASDDDDDLDIFRASNAKSKPSEHTLPATTQQQNSGSSESKKQQSLLSPSSTVKRVLSDEDLNKAPPPLLPLDDSADEDDLNWIS